MWAAFEQIEFVNPKLDKKDNGKYWDGGWNQIGIETGSED